MAVSVYLIRDSNTTLLKIKLKTFQTKVANFFLVTQISLSLRSIKPKIKLLVKTPRELSSLKKDLSQIVISIERTVKTENFLYC